MAVKEQDKPATKAAAPSSNGQTATPAKSLESRDARFRRLANRRMGKALKCIGYLPALANRSQYEYTPAQVAKMMDALNNAIVQVKAAFDGKAKTEDTFCV